MHGFCDNASLKNNAPFFGRGCPRLEINQEKPLVPSRHLERRFEVHLGLGILTPDVQSLQWTGEQDSVGLLSRSKKCHVRRPFLLRLVAGSGCQSLNSTLKDMLGINSPSMTPPF
jgi:hypothetical protein